MRVKRSRRNFLGALGAATTSVALAAPQPSDAQGEGAQRTPAETLTDLASQRFERFLNAREIRTMNAEIQGNLRAAESARAVPITNADEPCTHFVAETGFDS